MNTNFHVHSRSMCCVLFAILLLFCSCMNDDDDDSEDLGPEGGLDNDDVPKIGRIRAANNLDVKFAIIGDLHFKSDYKYDALCLRMGFYEPRARFLRPVSKDINSMCRNSDYGPDCTGIVNVGDLLRVPKGSGHWDDSVATYRHFYEYDHPDGNGKDNCNYCTYDKYPGGHAQTKYPVFVGVGNHDDASEFNDDEVKDYVRHRMAGSKALF